MATTQYPTQAAEVYGTLEVDDVIRVPQYQNALRVTNESTDLGLLGIEFVSNQTSAIKHLVRNEHSGRIYLTAGTSDKGETESIEIVTSTQSDEVPHDDEGNSDGSDTDSSTADESEQSDGTSGRTLHGREKTLAALRDTDTLNPIDAPEAIDDLVGAIEDMAVDGYSTPPEKPIRTLRKTHENLPDGAKQAYVTDHTIRRRINAARKQFNEWRGRKIRSQRIPSVMEAGPSNYNYEKTQRKARLARESNDELKDKFDRIHSAASGGRQRALQSIGSSVAEQNAKTAESKREFVRSHLEPGTIIQFRNPRVEVGRVVRVNKKTVTVEYDRGYTTDPLTGDDLDPLATTRVELDSNWLTILTETETLEQAQRDLESE